MRATFQEFKLHSDEYPMYHVRMRGKYPHSTFVTRSEEELAQETRGEARLYSTWHNNCECFARYAEGSFRRAALFAIVIFAIGGLSASLCTVSGVWTELTAVCSCASVMNATFGVVFCFFPNYFTDDPRLGFPLQLSFDTLTKIHALFAIPISIYCSSCSPGKMGAHRWTIAL